MCSMRGALVKTSVGPLLRISKSVISPVTEGTYEETARRYYKRFFRLRFFFGADYEDLLRWRFRGDFNCRRRAVLRVEDDLSEAEMMTRLRMTLWLVFNATVEKPAGEVKFWDDVRAATEPRPEAALVRTVLEMHRQSPASVRYDRRYLWIDDSDTFYEKMDLAPTKKAFSKMKSSDGLAQMGYADYEFLAMAANEQFGLLL